MRVLRTSNFDGAQRWAMLDVPANSPSVLACSEFAVGQLRWHGRI